VSARAERTRFFTHQSARYQIQLANYYLPHVRLPKTPNHFMFTLKMAAAKFAETLDNSQHLTRLILES
jgi:hypothetical protein